MLHELQTGKTYPCKHPLLAAIRAFLNVRPCRIADNLMDGGLIHSLGLLGPGDGAAAAGDGDEVFVGELFDGAVGGARADGVGGGVAGR